jgi:hypothetical protein
MPSKLRVAARWRAGRQQHGGVAVVAAGVHLAEHLAGPGLAAGLGDRQRVHVGAQADAAGAGARAQRAHHAGAAQAAVHLPAPALPALGHQVAGGVLFVGQLGVGVDLLADGDHLGFVGADGVEGGQGTGGVHGAAAVPLRTARLLHLAHQALATHGIACGAKWRSSNANSSPPWRPGHIAAHAAHRARSATHGAARGRRRHGRVVVDVLEVVDVEQQQHGAAGDVVAQHLGGQFLEVAAVGHLASAESKLASDAQPAARLAQLAFGAAAHQGTMKVITTAPAPWQWRVPTAARPRRPAPASMGTRAQRHQAPEDAWVWRRPVCGRRPAGWRRTGATAARPPEHRQLPISAARAAAQPMPAGRTASTAQSMRS